MMSCIKGRDTVPELSLRREVWALGWAADPRSMRGWMESMQAIDQAASSFFAWCCEIHLKIAVMTSEHTPLPQSFTLSRRFP